MRRPFAPGTAIDARRYKRWIDRFGSYREAVINVTINSWLENFEDEDQDLAARVLDVVEFYGQSQIHSAYRDALKAVPGWHKESQQRRGQWRFAAMSGSAGESGDAMLYQFRVANGLDAKRSRNSSCREAIFSDNLCCQTTIRGSWELMMSSCSWMISAVPARRCVMPGTTRRPRLELFSRAWERYI